MVGCNSTVRPVALPPGKETFVYGLAQQGLAARIDLALGETFAEWSQRIFGSLVSPAADAHTASGNSRRFEATFDFYVAGNPGRWHLGTTAPTLAEARGKIVLVRRLCRLSRHGVDGCRGLRCEFG